MPKKLLVALLVGALLIGLFFHIPVLSWLSHWILLIGVVILIALACWILGVFYKRKRARKGHFSPEPFSPPKPDPASKPGPAKPADDKDHKKDDDHHHKSANPFVEGFGFSFKWMARIVGAIVGVLVALWLGSIIGWHFVPHPVPITFPQQAAITTIQAPASNAPVSIPVTPLACPNTWKAFSTSQQVTSTQDSEGTLYHVESQSGCVLQICALKEGEDPATNCPNAQTQGSFGETHNDSIGGSDVRMIGSENPVLWHRNADQSVADGH